VEDAARINYKKEFEMFGKKDAVQNEVQKESEAKMYRQGDVLLVQVDGCPEDAKKLDHMTVAWGEATGHHHSFTKDVELREKNDMVWIVVDEPAELTHQEHATIVVDPGTYKYVRQREYAPRQNRWVLD
jgi:hypothetical protein